MHRCAREALEAAAGTLWVVCSTMPKVTLTVMDYGAAIQQPLNLVGRLVQIFDLSIAIVAGSCISWWVNKLAFFNTERKCCLHSAVYRSKWAEIDDRNRLVECSRHCTRHHISFCTGEVYFGAGPYNTDALGALREQPGLLGRCVDK